MDPGAGVGAAALYVMVGGFARVGVGKGMKTYGALLQEPSFQHFRVFQIAFKMCP